jgi:DNA mismatch repair protein MutS
MKTKNILLLFSFCSSLVSLSSFHTAYAHEKKTIYTKLARVNMGSLDWEEEEWPHEQFNDYLARCLRYQQNPQPFKKRKTAFTVCNEVEQQKESVNYSRVLDDVVTWEDLALFKGNKDETKHVYLADKINRTSTEFGRIHFFRMLAEPVVDIPTLQQRQAIIKELATNDQLYTDLKRVFEQLKATENLVLSFYAHDPLNTSAKNYCYAQTPFTGINTLCNSTSFNLQVINGHEFIKRLTFLTLGIAGSVVLPLYGLAQSVNYETPEAVKNVSTSLVGENRIIAMLSLCDNRVVKSAAFVAAGLFCISSLKKDYLWAKAHLDLLHCLQTRLIDVAAFVEAAQTVNALVETNKSLADATQLNGICNQLFNNQPQKNAQLAELLLLLEEQTFKGEPSAFSNHGNTLRAFKLMYEHKDSFKELLIALGELDAYLSVATLYREHKTKKAVFSFATFEQNTVPHIELTDFWNPFIDANQVQTSSIAIGGSSPRAFIITGSNEGGKSTLVKALAFNVIMAQSFGVGPARLIVLTPFSSVATYLNVTDDIAAGNSLFKSQVSRAHYLLERTENLASHEFSLLAVDEVFNGTSPREAEAAAYSFARYAGSFNNCISLFATHYPIMHVLAKEQGDIFANYRLRVVGQGDTKQRMFEPGISEQHLAINMLRSEGFNSKILADAQKVLSMQKH